MPRYLVQRTFPDGLEIPINHSGAETCGKVVAGNASHGVTWIHSYVSPDHHTTFCIYDGPDPSAIRCAAEHQRPPGGRDHRGLRCSTRTSTTERRDARPRSGSGGHPALTATPQNDHTAVAGWPPNLPGMDTSTLPRPSGPTDLPGGASPSPPTAPVAPGRFPTGSPASGAGRPTTRPGPGRRCSACCSPPASSTSGDSARAAGPTPSTPPPRRPAPSRGRRSSSAPATPRTRSPSTRRRSRCGRWRCRCGSSASPAGASWSPRR